MGDMIEYLRDRKEHSRQAKRKRLAATSPEGFTQHSAHHWSVKIGDDQLDYWPSTCRWRFKGKIHRGDPVPFITKRKPDWRKCDKD